MNVSQHLDDVADEQGWDDENKLSFTLSFLEHLVRDGTISAMDFRSYLEGAAQTENEDAGIDTAIEEGTRYERAFGDGNDLGG